jgi:hypothetical protein
MYKRIFVSHVVPKHLIEKLNVSPAANYFSYNLLSSNAFDQIISFLPTNLDKIDKKEFSQNIKSIQVRFLPHKGIFKCINIFCENIQLVFSIHRKSNVWFYNLTPAILLAFIILRYFRLTVNCYVIVLDYTPPSKRFSLQHLILKLINHAKGIIALSDNPNFTNKRKKIIPGIVPALAKKAEAMQKINYSFLLSGILVENRSPEMILNLFSKLPQYTLYITGIFGDEKTVIEYSKKYSNIKYFGYLPYEDYMKVLEEVSFCINSRNPNFEENKYNFPSKVIEYLLNNKIVISTMKYSQLEGIDYLFIELNRKKLYDFFYNLQQDEQSLLRYANQSEKIEAKMGVERWINAFNSIEK